MRSLCPAAVVILAVVTTLLLGCNTNDAVSVTATFGDKKATSTAEAANGVAGGYWAEGTGDDPEVSSSWVVLTGERQ